MQDNPTNFKKFKKGPLILSVIFLIFSCSAFYFVYKKINDNKTESEKIQKEWQIETTRREEIKSLDKSVKIIDSDRILLESHFAQSSDIVPFLDTIEKLATSAKATSEVVSVDVADDKNTLVLDLKASGSFEAIYKFLTLLENSPYELDFTAVDIQRTSAPVVSGKKVTAAEWGATFKIRLLSFTP